MHVMLSILLTTLPLNDPYNTNGQLVHVHGPMHGKKKAEPVH